MSVSTNSGISVFSKKRTHFLMPDLESTISEIVTVSVSKISLRRFANMSHSVRICSVDSSYKLQ